MTNNEAITWLRGIREQFTGNCTTDTLVPISRCDIQAIGLAIKALEERPQGKWEWVQYDANPNIGNWHCSECRYIPHGKKEYQKTNFCPNCGADMRGKEE